MTMKLEVSDSQSNHSDYSYDDSQSSQESSNNGFVSSLPNARSMLTLANLEGIQSGVPTRTTSTITPTQLRNLEQTYLDLTSRSDTNHAGFVPPSISSSNSYNMLNPYCDASGMNPLVISPGPMSASGDSSSSPGLMTPKRRNMGGRRPTKTPQDMSPEEQERRCVRRERNKQAAARCRKRRLDHTNELQDETDKLEEKKHAFHEEIRKLTAEKDQLDAILRAHKVTCRLQLRSASPPDVKPFQEPYLYTLVNDDSVRVKLEIPDPADPVLVLDNDIFASPATDKKIMLSAANPLVVTSPSPIISLDTPPVQAKPSRPNSLLMPQTLNTLNNKQLSNSKIAGIEISTPSNCIPFNFDSLMDGGTGLTPVHPHPHPIHLQAPLPHPCAHQQRSAPDATSPDQLSSLVSL